MKCGENIQSLNGLCRDSRVLAIHASINQPLWFAKNDVNETKSLLYVTSHSVNAVLSLLSFLVDLGAYHYQHS